MSDAAKRQRTEMSAWSPSSWRARESLQMATYDDDKAGYDTVIAKLSKVPPLVQPSECDRLIELLAAAGRGERFIVQGGDCAERFVDCEPERIAKQFEVLAQMSALIQAHTSTPGVTIARLAGQYGKPRSKPKENVEGFGELYSFKGDNINGYEPKDRKWDARRLLEGYWHSAATLNYVRSLKASDAATAGLLSSVDLGALEPSAEIGADAKALGASVRAAAAAMAPAVEIFTAHEGMQLDLEETLTRKAANGAHYNLSTHLLWIGDRTRQLDGGHVEYFRGIANPVGCKVGPSMKPDELKQLVAILNPDRIPGKLVLITRYGHAKARAAALLARARAALSPAPRPPLPSSLSFSPVGLAPNRRCVSSYRLTSPLSRRAACRWSGSLTACTATPSPPRRRLRRGSRRARSSTSSPSASSRSRSTARPAQSSAASTSSSRACAT